MGGGFIERSDREEEKKSISFINKRNLVEGSEGAFVEEEWATEYSRRKKKGVKKKGKKSREEEETRRGLIDRGEKVYGERGSLLT